MNTRPELITKLQTALSKCGADCREEGDSLLTWANDGDERWLIPYEHQHFDPAFTFWALDLMESWGFYPDLCKNVCPSNVEAAYTCRIFGSLTVKPHSGPDRAHAVAEALLAVATQRALPSMAVVPSEGE